MVKEESVRQSSKKLDLWCRSHERQNPVIFRKHQQEGQKSNEKIKIWDAAEIYKIKKIKPEIGQKLPDVHI